MKLAEYLFARLHQLGMRDLLGVPGDFNLHLLDYVEPSGLRWVGNCNELNAAYATDAYSRLQGIGALVTTFGVGELSAINGIAGAFAERAPVVHIVGVPALQLQAARAKVHHTFIDGDFQHFARMAKEVTVAQVMLDDAEAAAERIDHAIQQCMFHSRPVYIQVPTDLVEAEVEAARLSKPLAVPTSGVPSAPEAEVVEQLLCRIYGAKSVLVMVDGETRSMGVAMEVNDLVRTTRLPTLTSTFGKGCVDEMLPNVYGVYGGAAGPTDFQDFFNSVELVLCFGPHYSTTNTGMGRLIPAASKTVLFEPHAITFPQIAGQNSNTVQHLPLGSLLRSLVAAFDPSRLHSPAVIAAIEPTSRRQPPPLDKDAPLTQASFYPLIEPFIRPGDVVLGETGTPAYGTREMRLPSGCAYFGASTWLSIGYMMPATLGAALARRSRIAGAPTAATAIAAGEANSTPAPSANGTTSSNDRCMLFIGDGSLQMTVQEFSTIIHQRLNVLCFVINNSGYTIERCIHGWRAVYNDVAPWRYSEASSFFGAPEDQRRGWTVRTATELQEVLADPAVLEGKGLRVVEVILDAEDAPETLLRLTSRPPPK